MVYVHKLLSESAHKQYIPGGVVNVKQSRARPGAQLRESARCPRGVGRGSATLLTWMGKNTSIMGVLGDPALLRGMSYASRASSKDTYSKRGNKLRGAKTRTGRNRMAKMINLKPDFVEEKGAFSPLGAQKRTNDRHPSLWRRLLPAGRKEGSSVVCWGCYHGHHDALLVSAGSGEHHVFSNPQISHGVPATRRHSPVKP